MQTSLKEIIKQAKPDAEMRPAEEPGAIIPHAGILRGGSQVTGCPTLTRTWQYRGCSTESNLLEDKML